MVFNNFMGNFRGKFLSNAAPKNYQDKKEKNKIKMPNSWQEQQSGTMALNRREMTIKCALFIHLCFSISTPKARCHDKLPPSQISHFSLIEFAQMPPITERKVKDKFIFTLLTISLRTACR